MLVMGHSTMRHITAVYGGNTPSAPSWIQGHEQGQPAENLALVKDDGEHL